MEESERSIKAFIIPYEAWYKNVISGNPRIYIGLYYEAGGNDGEFGIVWDGIGIPCVCIPHEDQGTVP